MGRSRKHLCQICGRALSLNEVQELDGMTLCEDCLNLEKTMRAISLETLRANDRVSKRGN